MAEVQYNVWLDRSRFEDAEKSYQEHLARLRNGGAEASSSSNAATEHSSAPAKSSLACEIARAREHIQKSLGSDTSSDSALLVRIDSLSKTVQDLTDLVSKLTVRVSSLEKGSSGGVAAAPVVAPVVTPAPAAKEEPQDDDEEDDFELFDGNEEDEEEKERIKQERVKAYEERKAKKPVLIAKSNIILDVKPWDDETDMDEIERRVRAIEADGLLWGSSKFVPLAYGIRKLQISCVVEDDKVGVDFLEEEITKHEDFVQSVDIAAFNKI